MPVNPERDGTPLRPLRGALKRLWIGWIYDDMMRRLIHLLKYDSRPELAAELAYRWTKTVPAMKIAAATDVIIPVPIHSARRRHRGFNQSELLADSLSQLLHLSTDFAIVRRIVNTPSQTTLHRAKRWLSVAEIFDVVHPAHVAGQRVLIVDDLVTSGATLHSLATQLHRHGAATVSAAVLATPLTEGQST